MSIYLSKKTTLPRGGLLGASSLRRPLGGLGGKGGKGGKPSIQGVRGAAPPAKRWRMFAIFQRKNHK